MAWHRSGSRSSQVALQKWANVRKVEVQRAYYDTLFETSTWRLAALVMVGDDWNLA